MRGFLTMVRAAEPDVDVPGAGLVRTCKRPTPRILAPDEIVALMDLGPPNALRPHTVATVIGLLASCGLRASEAIRLDIDHVDLVGTPPCLQIQRTKFRKSRLVPLHPTTAAPRYGATPSNAASSAMTASAVPSMLTFGLCRCPRRRPRCQRRLRRGGRHNHSPSRKAMSESEGR